jgi:hypothetical protein
MYQGPNQSRQSSYGQPPQPYSQVPYNVPSAPGYTQPQPRKSRRRLFILPGILLGVVLLIIVAGIVLIVAVINSPAKTVVQEYYAAVKSQDYARAYSYLDIQALTLNGQQQPASPDVYTQVAQLIDQNNGKVTAYNITGVSLNASTSTGDTATITVDVTRGGKTQEVQVQLKQEGSDWKIVDIDHL